MQAGQTDVLERGGRADIVWCESVETCSRPGAERRPVTRPTTIERTCWLSYTRTAADPHNVCINTVRSRNTRKLRSDFAMKQINGTAENYSSLTMW